MSGTMPLTDQQRHFKISMGPGHVGKLEIMSMLIPLLKLEPSCPKCSLQWFLVLASLSLPKPIRPSATNREIIFFTSMLIVKFLDVLQC